MIFLCSSVFSSPLVSTTWLVKLEGRFFRAFIAGSPHMVRGTISLVVGTVLYLSNEQKQLRQLKQTD